MEIRELTSDERAALTSGISLAKKLLDRRTPLGSEEVQELYDYFLGREDEFPEGVIALGIAFGALIEAKAKYQWVRVSDEFGEETVLSPQSHKIICSPISIIQKRLQRGEAINIAYLRDQIIEGVEAQINSGSCEPR